MPSWWEPPTSSWVKPAKPWYEKLFVEELDVRLLKRLPDTEIHLIPYKEERASIFLFPRKSLKEGKGSSDCPDQCFLSDCDH